MVGRRGPLWLAGPTRFAAADRPTARLWLAAMAAATMIAAAFAPAAPLTIETSFEALLAATRHGSGYYDALADLLRSDPANGADHLMPPALTIVTAAVPGWAAMALLGSALAAMLGIGVARLTAAFDRVSGMIAVALTMIAGMVAGALLALDAPHAGVAALLVATSLFLRRHDRWGTSCALACAAAVIDPAALLAVAACGLLALVDGTVREAAGWLVAALVGVVVLACHLYAVALLRIDLTAFAGDADAAGRMMAGGLPGVPLWLAAPALLLSALGWAAWPDPLGLRIVALMGAGAAGETLFGLHSATLTTILVAPGLAFAPDALADLLRIAVDRRRITVTRIVR